MAEAKNPVCTVCKQEVEYPNFTCPKQPGKHTVPGKTYYHLGGAHIQSLRDRRMFSPNVVLIAGTEELSPTGQMISHPALYAQFMDGQYSTCDPEAQFYLDRRGDIPSGDEGLKRWREVYLTADQQLGVKRDELAEIERKIKEGNSLLDVARGKTRG